MTIIKNARVFAAQLPEIELMAECLEALPFVPVLETLRSSTGFVLDPSSGELVTPIAGGFSFAIRHDEKVLPKGPVKVKVAEALEAEMEKLERELTDEEIGVITEAVIAKLIAVALVKSSVARAFYYAADELLVVGTSSSPVAQMVMRTLIKALASVKTSTINIDDVRQGLSTRLTNHLNGVDSAFDGFKLGDYCRLADKGRSAVFDMSDLSQSGAGMRESIESGMQVDRLGLTHELMEFRLTKDFALVKIAYPEQTEEQRDAFGMECGESKNTDAAFYWRHEAGVELLQVAAAIRALCALFNYQRPADLPESLAPDVDEPEDSDAESADPLHDAGVEFVLESGRASISAVQRKLKICYNRAARMIEKMEVDGVVTAIDSHGARKVCN
jgi:recombination associated protein RdgC